MTNLEMTKLESGDIVKWDDPDMDADCSRTDVIDEIKINGEISDDEFEPDATDMTAYIQWPGGSNVLVFAYELEKVD